MGEEQPKRAAFFLLNTSIVVFLLFTEFEKRRDFERGKVGNCLIFSGIVRMPYRMRIRNNCVELFILVLRTTMLFEKSRGIQAEEKTYEDLMCYLDIRH
jgi:hypothetical protein